MLRTEPERNRRLPGEAAVRSSEQVRSGKKVSPHAAWTSRTGDLYRVPRAHLSAHSWMETMIA